MTSDRTGPRPIKTCSKCGVPKHQSKFHAHARRPDGLEDRCKLCVADSNAHINPRGNAISKIAYGIAGSSAKFYRLTKDERLHIRDIAAQLHDAGQTVGRAEAYEETNRNGFVYVIYHRRLQGIKIGRACNPESRLRGYQTGCPFRQYKLAYAQYFEDCYTAEAEIHARLNAHQLEGEWFNIEPDQGEEAIAAYARDCDHQLENIT